MYVFSFFNKFYKFIGEQILKLFNEKKYPTTFYCRKEVGKGAQERNVNRR